MPQIQKKQLSVLFLRWRCICDSRRNSTSWKENSRCRKKLTKEPIKLKLSKNILQVISGKSKFTLNIFKVSDYPVIKPSQAEYFADIECSILEEAINSVCYAASTSNQRPILKGIHLTVSENLMTFQSTDSHQLAYKAIKLQTAFKEEIKMTIPAIALKEAINSFDIKIN